MKHIHLHVSLKARINHGRWIVDCPSCKNAAKVSPLVDEFFTCTICNTISTVCFPAEFSLINAILNMRPEKSNRNWFPNETVQDLVKENLDHGITIFGQRKGG